MRINEPVNEEMNYICFYILNHNPLFHNHRDYVTQHCYLLYDAFFINRQNTGNIIPYRCLLNLSAVEEAYGARGLLCLLLVVGYHHNGATIFTVEFVENLHNLCTHL